MKNLKISLVSMLIIVSISFTQCSKESDLDLRPVNQFNPDTISFEHSMKGWELYSWPNGDDWNYSILPGTNRTKSYVEVTGNRIVVLGRDSLKMLLDKIPEGESIFWIGQGWLARCWGGDFGDLALPDSRTLSEIKTYCAQKNLELFISD